MSIWSVDAIEKVQLDSRRPMILSRFVHYKPEPEGTPGVRYFLSPVEAREFLDWGRAYYLSGDFLQSLRRDGQTMFLERPGDPLVEVELELRAEVRAAFESRRSERGDERNLPRASPLRRRDSETTPPWARIHVHNVGQGDTIVVELPDNQVWLVDARLWGERRRRAFEEWMDTELQGRKRFDRVIISHLHYDHIHSIPYILDTFDVGEVWVPDSLDHPTSSVTRVWRQAGQRLRTGINARTEVFGGVEVQTIFTKDIPTLKASVTGSRDPNDHEIAIVLKTQKSGAFLAGDIPGAFCREILTHSILSNPSGLKTLYYKVSHHGSNTGYDEAFFDAYRSNYAIISCGAANRYQHPHNPPLKKLPRWHNITHRDGEEVYTCRLL